LSAAKEKLEPPDTGFFNAGQKTAVLGIAIGSIVFLITGIILWAGARTFGSTLVAISYVLHDMSAIVMLGGIFVHIYLSTIGEPGTFQAMTRGAVSEPWAWTFHPAWYRELTGRGSPRILREGARGNRTGRETEPFGVLAQKQGGAIHSIAPVSRNIWRRWAG